MSESPQQQSAQDSVQCARDDLLLSTHKRVSADVVPRPETDETWTYVWYAPMSGGESAGTGAPTRSCVRPSGVPWPAPRLPETTRPIESKIGGTESMLDMSWPDRLRQAARVTRD